MNKNKGLVTFMDGTPVPKHAEKETLEKYVEKTEFNPKDQEILHRAHLMGHVRLSLGCEGDGKLRSYARLTNQGRACYGIKYGFKQAAISVYDFIRWIF